jgi:hypothetical protein
LLVAIEGSKEIIRGFDTEALSVLATGHTLPPGRKLKSTVRIMTLDQSGGSRLTTAGTT